MTDFLHPVSPRVLPRPIVFSREFESRSLSEDRDIIGRIVAAYHAAIGQLDAESRESMAGGVWGGQGYEGRQAGLIAALQRGSAAEVHSLLKQFFRTDAAHAIGPGREEAELLRLYPEHARCYGLQWIDCLV